MLLTPEIRKNTSVVLRNVQGTSSIDFRINKNNRLVVINSTGSPPTQTASSLFATKGNISVAEKSLLSTYDKIENANKNFLS